jgi:hypothetical protein
VRLRGALGLLDVEQDEKACHHGKARICQSNAPVNRELDRDHRLEELNGDVHDQSDLDDAEGRRRDDTRSRVDGPSSEGTLA